MRSSSCADCLRAHIALDASSNLVGRTLGPVNTTDGSVTLSFPALTNNFPPDPNQGQ